jgi:hypothetical protein
MLIAAWFFLTAARSLPLIRLMYRCSDRKSSKTWRHMLPQDVRMRHAAAVTNRPHVLALKALKGMGSSFDDVHKPALARLLAEGHSS